MFEKQKVREIASLIRDTDRHGKARIVDANEGDEPEEMVKVDRDMNNIMINFKPREEMHRFGSIVFAGLRKDACVGRQHARRGQQS